MLEIDKKAMGRRVKQIRLREDLKQWELARLLGTTQSAVHKYEHGVVPEPRRLLALAKIGRTSVEWILTGHHWDGGSEEVERPDPGLFETAERLRRLETAEREAVEEALRLLEAAAEVAGPDSGDAADLLAAAERIRRSLSRRLLDDARRRLSRADTGPSRAHS